MLHSQHDSTDALAPVIPIGTTNGPMVTEVPVRFVNRLELARMAALPRLASGPEPVSIGRGWLLQTVRARRAAGVAAVAG
jgi:hypothetical protein